MFNTADRAYEKQSPLDLMYEHECAKDVLDPQAEVTLFVAGKSYLGRPMKYLGRDL